jgi:UDP-N-acetylmuramoyl-tripeptide--D-alanyl-D-alanine ligase
MAAQENRLMPIRFLRISPAQWRRRALLLTALLWRRLLVRTRIVAVTGSLGKTTAKEMLAAILSAEGRTLANAGTSNRTIDVATLILRARPWHRYVVVEIGTDSPGWIARSTLIARPDVAVVLNVGRTHTNRFRTLEDTAREKAELLGRLGRRGVAILNADDPRVAGMGEGKPFRVVRFGQGEAAGVRAREINACWPERLSLTLESGGVRQRVSTRLVGRHWANSVVAAAAAALECGVPLDRIAAAMSRVEPFTGRLDPRTLPGGAVILRDDGNGSIQSFEAAFQVLREAQAARKILAITTVSDSEEGWVPRLRRIVSEAAEVADVVVLVGAGTDTRRAWKAAARNSVATPIHHFDTKRAAAEFLHGFLRMGDLALLRGLGVDHMGRLYHAQTGEVSCWIDYCPKMILCEDCQELRRKPDQPSLVSLTLEQSRNISSTHGNGIAPVK